MELINGQRAVTFWQVAPSCCIVIIFRTGYAIVRSTINRIKIDYRFRESVLRSQKRIGLPAKNKHNVRMTHLAQNLAKAHLVPSYRFLEGF